MKAGVTTDPDGKSCYKSITDPFVWCSLFLDFAAPILRKDQSGWGSAQVFKSEVNRVVSSLHARLRWEL